MQQLQSYENIFAVLSEFINNNLHVDIKPLRPQHKLQEDLGLDSINLLTLAVEIENHFEIYLAESADPPETLDDVVNLILYRLKQRRPDAS